MKIKALLTVSTLAAALAACGGGDISIDAANRSTSSTDNSVGDGAVVITNGSGGAGDSALCASFVRGGQTVTGTADGSNCVYGSSFSDLTNPIVLDSSAPVTFRALPNDGVHVFNASLVIGKSYDTRDEQEEASRITDGVLEGGDGTIIRMDAGSTLAFRSSDDYFVINRGSQIFAEGESGSPVTVTSVSDAVDGSVGPEEVQQWGGMIINGFGVTNKCTYTGTREVDLALVGTCSIAAEGKAGAGTTYYGGNNDADNSGILNYFIVKHTGAEVTDGNELNGIAFNAVGSGTQVNYLQAYATYDDGIEFFGGAVNINYYIGLYVNDDSIDIDEGYRGTIDYALVIQSETDGNRCVESDGIGSYGGFVDDGNTAAIDDMIARGLNSEATIRNLTCIISPVSYFDDPSETPGIDSTTATSTHDPGQGLRIREAHFPTIENALITTAYLPEINTGDDDYNYCVRIDNEGEQAALDGDLTITSTIVACQDLVDGDLEGSSTLDWLNANGNQTYQSAEAGEDPSAASNPNLQILDGFYSLPLNEMVVNGGPTTVTPTEGRAFVGAVSADNDWTANWSYGLDGLNQGQPLYFQ